MSISTKVPRAAVALAGVAALALPAAALAKGPNGHGHGHKDVKSHEAHGHHGARAPHRVQYVFRGTWSAGAVQVTGGNHHVRRAGLLGQSVAFDLSAARIVVADANGDGARDAADLRDGDRVLVQARLSRSDPGAGPFAARKLVDKGQAQADPESEPEQD